MECEYLSRFCPSEILSSSDSRFCTFSHKIGTCFSRSQRWKDCFCWRLCFYHYATNPFSIKDNEENKLIITQINVGKMYIDNVDFINDC